MTRTPEQAADLVTVPNEMEAGIIRGVLTDAGIESWQHAAPGAETGIWGTTSFLPVVVRVRAEDLGAARDVLESNRRDSVDLDWSEVDVGEPQDPIAARIARADERAIERTRSGAARGTPRLWAIVSISALLLLAGGLMAFVITQVFHASPLVAALAGVAAALVIGPVIVAIRRG